MTLRPNDENSIPQARPNRAAPAMPISAAAVSVQVGNSRAAAARPISTATWAITSSTPARHLARHSCPRSPGSASRNASVRISRSPARSMAPQITP